MINHWSTYLFCWNSFIDPVDCKYEGKVPSWFENTENTVLLFWKKRELSSCAGSTNNNFLLSLKYGEHDLLVLELQRTRISLLEVQRTLFSYSESTENLVLLWWKYKEICVLVLEVKRTLSSCVINTEYTSIFL